MAESNYATASRTLLDRVRKFLARGKRRNDPLALILQRIQERQWSAVLFGGTLRDLMLFGTSSVPRDVDIVVANATTEEIMAAFAGLTFRRTRFGGLRILNACRTFDVWPLPETWAFRQSTWKTPSPDFDSLTKTTFLNAEAIAVEFVAPKAKQRPIHAHGFFESLATKTLEINFEENPFPALCVVRSLLTAARLQFSIGPKLARYLVHYGKVFPPEELESVELDHYGSCRYRASDLSSWLGVVEDQYRRGLPSSRGARLPPGEGSQLPMFEKTPN